PSHAAGLRGQQSQPVGALDCCYSNGRLSVPQRIVRGTTMKRISRRALLCGAGGIGLALPMLELMRPRVLRAQTVAPRRIMFVFQANGYHTAARFARGADTNFELGDFLRPLEPYKSELLFLNRLHRRFHELPQGERADNHQQGGSSLAPWASGAGSFPIGGTE